MHTGSWKQHSKHHHQQWAPSPFVFMIFPCFIGFLFSFSIAMLSIFRNVPCTLRTLPNIISHYDFSLIYCYFSFSIAIPSIFGNGHWILKIAPQPSSPTVSTIPLCFYDFPYFYKFFSFSIATHSIFGNAHCTLKALPNIITNSEHHPLFFLWKFPSFPFAKAHISTFGSAHWTLKTVPTVVTNSEHHCWGHQCTL